MTPQENPPEDKPIVTFVMEAEDHDALLAAAAELGCTPAEMVRRITARHVASYKTP